MPNDNARKPDTVQKVILGEDKLVLSQDDIKNLYRHLSINIPDTETSTINLIQSYIDAAKMYMIEATGRHFLNATYEATWNDVREGETLTFFLKPIQPLNGFIELEEGYYVKLVEDNADEFKVNAIFEFSDRDVTLLKQVLNTIVADFYRNREAYTMQNLNANQYVRTALARYTWDF